MIGRRALEIFGSFTTGQLAFTAKEIEELLKMQIVVEIDPRDAAALEWLEPVLLGHVQVDPEDPTAPHLIAAKLAEVDEKLKSSWSRLTTRDSKVKAQETERRMLRRALAMLNDKTLIARLAAARSTMKQAATPFYQCPTLGDERYALTAKGGRVQHALSLRGDRFADHPLSAFMKPFDKTEAKMVAFSGDIQTLSGNIGYVKKNPHQVVIGLVKSGMPTDQALGTYKATVKAVGAPDVAVTLTRNASSGGTQAAAARLREAQQAMIAAGFPNTPEVMGAAKTLLPFDPIVNGVHRFVEIINAVLGSGIAKEQLDVAIKCTARLMAADGMPGEVVNRVLVAKAALKARRTDIMQIPKPMLETALGAMARELAAVEPLVDRFRQVEAELVRAKVGHPNQACANALECVACPGTPVEVVDTVRTLAYQVAYRGGRGTPNGSDIAVAVAFAKRFAY